MSEIESFVVFFPRFTSLVGGPGAVSFSTIPLDVSKFGGVQLDAWISDFVYPQGSPQVKVYLEESLDGAIWPATMSTPYTFTGSPPYYSSKFFSFGFRLRWFRVRMELTNVGLISCYVEGIMRAGGGGGREWIAPPPEAVSTAPGTPALALRSRWGRQSSYAPPPAGDINAGEQPEAPGRAAGGPGDSGSGSPFGK